MIPGFINILQRDIVYLFTKHDVSTPEKTQEVKARTTLAGIRIFSGAFLIGTATEIIIATRKFAITGNFGRVAAWICMYIIYHDLFKFSHNVSALRGSLFNQMRVGFSSFIKGQDEAVVDAVGEGTFILKPIFHINRIKHQERRAREAQEARDNAG